MLGFQSSCRALRVFGGMVLVGLSAGAAIGGDLDPPPGAVGPTMKTLDEVEARIAINATNTPGDDYYSYRLDAPGSYYLTANLIGEAGKTGIRAVEGVTIDLNGYTLVGVGSQSGTRAIEFIDGEGVIRNGWVRGWQWGVYASGGGPYGEDEVIVDGLQIHDCANGIHVGPGARISDCVLVGSRESGIYYGIRCDDDSLVERCTVRDFHAAGILLADQCVCSQSVVSDCGWGISLTSGVLDQCTAIGNSENGIYVGTGLVRGCVANHNGSYGYEISNGTLTGCVSQSNGAEGVLASGELIIHDCSIAYNQGKGIIAEYGCVVERCSITRNGSAGIELESGAGDMVVRGCRISRNGGWGIRVRDRCLVEDNLITRNGVETTTNYAGLIVLGDDTLVRGNVIVGNDQGFFDAGTTNVWIDNVVQNNTPLP